MGVRNSGIRRKRKLNRHSSPLCKRRQKVRWLLAQRVRVRAYRRSFEGHGADSDIQNDDVKEQSSE